MKIIHFCFFCVLATFAFHSYAAIRISTSSKSNALFALKLETNFYMYSFAQLIEASLKICWFVVTRLGLQEKCRSKKNAFEAHSWKTVLSYNYIFPAYPVDQSKLLVLSSASMFNCSYCFDFSYPLSSLQVSLDCAR